MKTKLPFNLESVLEKVSKVKLSGGVVGKVCTTLIIVALSTAVICWSVGQVWVAILALVLLFLLSFVMLWRVISFADKNPQAALLEGAEFLVHQQLAYGSKENPEVDVSDQPRLTEPQIEELPSPEIQSEEDEQISPEEGKE